MTYNLKKLLRDLANCRHDDFTVVYEAADLIEQLEAERDELELIIATDTGTESAVEKLQHELSSVTAERDELKADAMRYQKVKQYMFLDGDSEETFLDIGNFWQFGSFSSVDKFIDAAIDVTEPKS